MTMGVVDIGMVMMTMGVVDIGVVMMTMGVVDIGGGGDDYGCG